MEDNKAILEEDWSDIVATKTPEPPTPVDDEDWSDIVAPAKPEGMYNAEPKGFVENMLDWSEDTSYLKHAANVISKAVMSPLKRAAENPDNPNYTPVEAEAQVRETKSTHVEIPQSLQEAMDVHEQLTEKGLQDHPQVKKLEEDIYNALQDLDKQEAQDVGFINAFLDAWNEDKGAVVATLVKGALLDPEFFLVPEAGSALAGKLTTTLAKIGNTAARTAAKYGVAVSGGAAAEATLGASLEALRQLDVDGKLDGGKIKEVAAISGVFGGSMAATTTYARAAIAKYRDKKLDKLVSDISNKAVPDDITEQVAKDTVDLKQAAVERVSYEESITKTIADIAEDLKKDAPTDVRSAVIRAINNGRRKWITGETLEEFNERMFLKGEDPSDLALKEQQLADMETDIRSRIKSQQEEMWSKREAELEELKNTDADKFYRQRAKEQAEVQELIGKYIPELESKGSLGTAMENAAMGTSLTAVSKKILDTNYKLRAMKDVELAERISGRLTDKELTELLLSPRTPMQQAMLRAARVTRDLTDREASVSARNNPVINKQQGNIDPKLLAAFGGITVAGGVATALWNKGMEDEAMAALTVPLAPFAWRALRGYVHSRGSTSATMATKLFEPISDRIKGYSEKLWLRMRELEHDMSTAAHSAKRDLAPFLNKYNKLKKKEKNALWKAMLNQDSTAVRTILKQHPKLAKEYKRVRAVLDALYEVQKKLGVKMGYLKEYMPRVAKDVHKVRELMELEDKALFDSLLEKAAKKKGVPALSPEEEVELLSAYLNGYLDSKYVKMIPGYTKRRSNIKITDEMLEYFADPAEALSHYVSKSLENIYRRRLFGKVIREKHGDNITEAIHDLVGKMKGMDADDARELKALIQLRFEAASANTHKVISVLKNLTYLSLLGNPHSAVTQIADISLSMYKNGARDTVVSLYKVLARKNAISAKEMGLIDNVSHETSGHLLSADRKLMEASFNIGGFKHVDALGKSVMIQASLRKWSRAARNIAKGRSSSRVRDLQEYESILGKDRYTQLLNDLQTQTLSSDVKLLAFMDLADLQPINLLEMPEVYLRHPDGRIMYMLQTFTVKFLNIVKQDVFKKWKAGDRVGATKNLFLLYSYAALGNVGAEELKNFLFNKGQEQADVIANGMLKATGIFNKYLLQDISTSYQPVTDFIASFAPPGAIFDPYVRAMFEIAANGEVSSGTVGKAIRNIPFIGPLYYYTWKNANGQSGDLFGDDWSDSWGDDWGDSFSKKAEEGIGMLASSISSDANASGVPRAADEAISRIIRDEGGFQNDPDDSGNYAGSRLLGTNMGITPNTYAAYKGVDVSSLTEEDMRNITKEEARDIYLKEYYYGAGIDQLSSKAQPLGMAISVMSGPGKAKQLIRISGGDAAKLATEYKKYLNRIIKNNPKKAKYRRGWFNRIDRAVREGK